MEYRQGALTRLDPSAWTRAFQPSFVRLSLPVAKCLKAPRSRGAAVPVAVAEDDGHMPQTEERHIDKERTALARRADMAALVPRRDWASTDIYDVNEYRYAE